MKVCMLVLLTIGAVLCEPPVPQYFQTRRLGYNAPASSYGPPSNGGNNKPVPVYGPPQTQPPNGGYLPPANGGNNNNGEDDKSEPANYQFEYAVLDQQSGNDFGHSESRQGDVAKGTYYVLLPDGRKQTVEYVADNEGYKPKITYEETGNAGGSGNNNGGNGNNNNGGYRYRK